MPSLEPDTTYAHLDMAVWAACCLCGLDPAGATIYGTTDPVYADPDSGEAYRVVTAAVQRGGKRWTAPTDPAWTPTYTILRGRSCVESSKRS